MLSSIFLVCKREVLWLVQDVVVVLFSLSGLVKTEIVVGFGVIIARKVFSFDLVVDAEVGVNE